MFGTFILKDMPKETDSKTVIDVTQVSLQPFLTGIQRLVRGLAAESGPETLLARFDPSVRQWREVDHIPELVSGKRDGLTIMLAYLVFWPLLIAKRFPSLIRLASAKHRALGSRLLRGFFGEKFLLEDPHWILGPVVHFGIRDVLLVPDVPQDDHHPKALEKLARSRSGPRVWAYGHDLIPIRQAPQYDPKGWQARVGNFEQYVDFLACCDGIVCNSSFTLAEFGDWFRKRKLDTPRLELLYPPRPDLPEVPNQPVSPGRVEAGGNRSEGALTLLGVGALDARKNFKVIVRALPVLSMLGREASLILVAGSGKPSDPEFHRALRALPRSLRRKVQVTGDLADHEIAELYRSADVVVVPSKAEGFGLPVVEALAMGCPVVVSRATSLIELSEIFNLETAEPDDPEGWAHAILEATEKKYGNILWPDEIPKSWSHFAKELLKILNRNHAG